MILQALEFGCFFLLDMKLSEHSTLCKHIKSQSPSYHIPSHPITHHTILPAPPHITLRHLTPPYTTPPYSTLHYPIPPYHTHIMDSSCLWWVRQWTHLSEGHEVENNLLFQMSTVTFLSSGKTGINRSRASDDWSWEGIDGCRSQVYFWTSKSCRHYF